MKKYFPYFLLFLAACTHKPKYEYQYTIPTKDSIQVTDTVIVTDDRGHSEKGIVTMITGQDYYIFFYNINYRAWCKKERAVKE